MGDELKWLLKEGDGRIFGSCDISLENTPTSHSVSLVLVICTCSDSSVSCHALAYAITANGVCLHLLVPALALSVLLLRASCLHNSTYCGINGWAYLREKSTLCNNFIQKRGVGIFSRVGLFSGDYGIC